MNVSAPAGTTVAINGDRTEWGLQPERHLLAGRHVRLRDERVGLDEHLPRAVPTGVFPRLDLQQTGPGKAKLYITTPLQVKAPDGQQAGDYAAIYDDDGVPVWWKKSPGAIDAKLLPDGTLGRGTGRFAESAQDFGGRGLDVSSGPACRPVAAERRLDRRPARVLDLRESCERRIRDHRVVDGVPGDLEPAAIRVIGRLHRRQRVEMGAHVAARRVESLRVEAGQGR